MSTNDLFLEIYVQSRQCYTIDLYKGKQRSVPQSVYWTKKREIGRYFAVMSSEGSYPTKWQFVTLCTSGVPTPLL